MSLLNGLYVAAGGALGSVARWAIQQSGLPLATFWINLLGSFAIGVAMGRMHELSNESARVFVMTGILGGFTTFSAFSAETLQLIQSDRNLHAIAYVVGTVGLGLLMTALGVWSRQ
jgi:CrcB protein